MELPNRPTHEAEFARRLSLVSSKHRRELVRLLGNPPDPNNVPQSFWDAVEREQKENLMLALLLLFMASAEFHGMDNADARTLGQSFASERAGSVSADYVVTSRDRLTTIAGEWKSRQETLATGRGLSGPAVKYIPLDPLEIESGTLDVFGPERDANIAVTETTVAQSAGGEAAAQTLGIASPDDTWYTAEDSRVCPICQPLHETKREYWSRFFPSGPPGHPRCRCWLVYANVPSLAGAR